jgi:hypothetical protein
MTPTYAILFKCHYWDAFTQRQLERLQQRTTNGDIFVVVDETLVPVGGIDFPDDRILRISRRAAEDIGLDHSGPTPVFWYSNDFPLHLFTRQYPHYDYFLMTEFDVVTTVDLDALMVRLRDGGVDFVGEPIRTPLAQWPWLASCAGWYETEQVLHWLCCLAIFSNRAAHYLYRRRTLAALRVREGGAEMVPMCEAVIPTELRLGGFRLVPLGELGPTACYDTTPPRPEAMLPALVHEAFIHPVLDRTRFVVNLLRDTQNPIDLLNADHPHHRLLGADGVADLLPHLHRRFYTMGDDEGCRRIVARMRESDDPAYLRLHGLDGRNLALGKPAMQSSTCEWSLRPDEATGAVMGPVTGGFTFHTAAEDRPWWKVDLMAPQRVGQVRVFNRVDVLAVRANGLELYVSADGRNWELAGRHEGATPFGGVDGYPLEIDVNRMVRFVRLEVPWETILHLDQVQVWAQVTTHPRS